MAVQFSFNDPKGKPVNKVDYVKIKGAPRNLKKWNNVICMVISVPLPYGTVQYLHLHEKRA